MAGDDAGLIADGFWFHTPAETDHLSIEIEEHPDELIALPLDVWDDLRLASALFDAH